MSDVEEAILRSQENVKRLEEANAEYLEEDEFGIVVKCPIKQFPDKALGYYLAIRVILKNRKRRESERLIYVDKELGGIRCGLDMPLNEDKSTLLRLSASSYTRPGATAYAWEYLHKLLPVLDRSKLVIIPGLIFDRKTGEIIETDGKELTI